jgi:TatD DNase family protein
MAPEPHRGTRNNSLNINYVAAKIAEIKGVTKEEVEDITYKNAMNFYRIPREA